MYEIKNLTNEVQYLCFRSGKDCVIAGKASLAGIRDSEITPVINKMNERKIISLVEVKATRQATARKSESVAEQETDRIKTPGKVKK